MFKRLARVLKSGAGDSGKSVDVLLVANRSYEDGRAGEVIVLLDDKKPRAGKQRGPTFRDRAFGSLAGAGRAAAIRHFVPHAMKGTA